MLCVRLSPLFFFMVLVMRRHKMSRGRSERSFTSSAMRVHPKNNVSAPMRGGIRL